MRSVGPRDAEPRVRGKIRIEAGPKPAAAASGSSVTPEQYWLNYYRTHDDHTKTQSAAEGLREKVALLNVNKKFRDVRAVLIGFLTYHSRDAESWMYSALALATRMNKGSEADVKTALGYAADMALRSGNPNQLVSVADQALLMGETDRVGALLDRAAALVPHRGEPLVMSVNLARKLKDPKRMGDSVEKLLALGWPGMDEAVRRDARTQVEALAKGLREDGRGDEADALLARLPDAEARDLFIRLTWLGEADLDLVVDEPLNATARVATPRTVFGGAIVKNGLGNQPEEVYVCPRAFDGTYTVRVETIANDPDNPALKATLEVITHEGTPREHKETRSVVIPTDGKPSDAVTVQLKGGRRTSVLPFVAPEAASRPARPRATPAASPAAREGAARKR